MSTDLEERPSNVKRLILPEGPKPDNTCFDIQRDVPEWAWQKCLQQLTAYAEKKDEQPDLKAYCSLASNMLILFPEKREELKLLPENEVLVPLIIESELDLYLSDLIIMYPDNYADLLRHREPLELPDTVIMVTSRSKMWDRFIQYPEKHEEVKKTPDLKEELVDRIAMARHEMREVEEWHDFAFYKLMCKLYGFEEEAAITDEEWEAMRKSTVDSVNNPMYFTEMAVYMKLLAAKEVRMTEQGLEIIMPEPTANLGSTPQVPVTKKY